MDYTNFKGAIKDDARHRPYMQVWQTMLSVKHYVKGIAKKKAAHTRMTFDFTPEQPPLFEDDYNNPSSPFYDPGWC